MRCVVSAPFRARAAFRCRPAARNEQGGRLLQGRLVVRAASSPLDENALKAASDPESQSLAQKIIEAEAELKEIFAPGKIPPKAAIVAKKRQAISEMKELLAAKLSGKELSVNPDASDDEAERARQLFLEVERSLQRQQRPESFQDGEYSFELSLLEEENDRLRQLAESLLERQQQLEDLAEKHGIIQFSADGSLKWVEPSQREKAAAEAAKRRQPVDDRLERALQSNAAAKA